VSAATKQSRLGRVTIGTDCFADALATDRDDGSLKLSLDCFVAALPRNRRFYVSGSQTAMRLGPRLFQI
jgi:hypothetical protein